MKSGWLPWLMIALTTALTSYGQLVLKWQVGGGVLSGSNGILRQMPVLLVRPWVISAFAAAFGASLCWMVALSRLELSRAYPFMALNFILVSLLAVPFFGENFGFQKAIGLLFVVVGLVFIGRG